MPEPATKESLFRQIPSVDQILLAEGAKPLLAAHGREATLEAVRCVIGALRERLKGSGPVEAADVSAEAILRAAGATLARTEKAGLCRVLNATGIILHTGLGRAPLPKAAVDAIVAEQRGYSLLEVDRASGDRGYRETFVRDLVCRVTGAEAATVVNNNAAATMICLAAYAAGREVIVSRGQLVEIGGSFRMPDVMAMSGAKLVEVGTTNRTYVSDYEKAITPATALLMRVHPSNYKVQGFTAEVEIEELVALGRKHNLPVMDDLGSGALVDFTALGIGDEPMVSRSLAAGVDLSCFSCDKLIGGPQGGFILGKKDAIARIRRHPLFRAFRIDKLSLTALEATLKLYLHPETLAQELPVLRMITMPKEVAFERAQRMVDRLVKIPGVRAELWEETSQLGGGSLPGHDLPTVCAAFRAELVGPDELLRRLRVGEPCLFARAKKDHVLFDPRTLLEGEDAEAIAAVERALA